MVVASPSPRAEGYLRWTKVAIGLLGYVPYLFMPRAIRLMPALDRYTAVGMGLCLLLSVFLQTRRFAARLPVAARGACAGVADEGLRRSLQRAGERRHEAQVLAAPELRKELAVVIVSAPMKMSVVAMMCTRISLMR